MEIQVPHLIVKLYHPNGRLKEQIDYDETGKKHGQHLLFTEDGQLDIVHFYERGQLVCVL